MILPVGIYQFKTLSGSKYVLEITENKCFLQRFNQNFELRRDTEKVEVQRIDSLTVGESAVFFLEPLGEGVGTFRFTTEVVELVVLSRKKE